ncbi:MAG: ABC transporter permease, partial [Bdellovibrionales bacterium]
IWPFVHPAITVLLFWFVFTFGLRTQPAGDYPFILWLLAGMIPWFYFSEALPAGTPSICEYAFLVKKMVFRVGLLPLVKMISALGIHLFFLFVTVLIFLASGERPNLYWLQIGYYLFATLALLTGLTLITSSLMVFAKDVGQIVGILIQFGFWATPVFWQIKIVPEKLQPWIKLNPVLYLVEGYRDSLVYKAWFWDKPGMTIYFWVLTAILLVVGTAIFKKSRPHFADVL